MKIKYTILVVEKDATDSKFLKKIFEANSYEVITANSGREAYAMISSYCPDMVTTCLNLSDMNGLTLIEKIREWSNIPVIVISSETHERIKVNALDKGADDYIQKPFGTAELLARVRTAIRHTLTTVPNKNPSETGKYTVGDITIDYEKYRVYKSGKDAGLTHSEFKLVALLGKYAGKVLTYEFLIRELWGPNKENDNQILRVNMANIRKKLESTPQKPRYIITEAGIGYRMADE